MIFVTGGTGYIGSHTSIALVHEDYDVLILDNLSNSHPRVLDRLQSICGIRPKFIEGDIRNGIFLDDVFRRFPISAVIHFAGLKAVGESVTKPLEYYDNNVNGTLQLLAAMGSANVKSTIFSSSVTVYGDPATLPIKEDAPRSATNCYGRSKLILEDILADHFHAQPNWSITRLRYSNPVGTHESGMIGEGPQGFPNNLMPFISQAAIGRRERLSVFGGDYPTHDGTGVRDYIHVMDLAEEHVAVLKHCKNAGGILTVNLGTEKVYSVLEMIDAFQAASHRPIPYEIAARRPGDVAQRWADPTHAKEMQGWHAKRGLTQMCTDTWRWQQRKPNGYK